MMWSEVWTGMSTDGRRGGEAMVADGRRGGGEAMVADGRRGGEAMAAAGTGRGRWLVLGRRERSPSE